MTTSPTESTLPVIGDVKYFYDATGLKTKVTDALNHSTEYFFDYTKHQLTRTLDALGKELKYYYDAKNRVTKTGAGSSGDIMPTLNYYNDTTGMMTKVRYTDAASATSDVQYFFNKARQMTKLTDWTGDLEYRYSNIGQLTKIIDYDTEDLLYAYDPVGRVTSMTDYHGATTSYEYDDGGRLTTLIAPGSKEWEFVYNDLGQPIETYNPYGSAAKSAKSKFFQCNLPDGQGGKINPDGTVETFGYDSRNRLTRRYLGTEATGGTDLEEFLYELDAVGNITKTTELDGTEWVYAYDARYRLTSAVAAEGTKKKWKETYVYDNGDNLLTKRVPFTDNFDDLDDDLEWNGASTYVATKGYMERESGAIDAGNCRLQSEHDFHMWFSYLHGGTSDGQIRIREYSGGHLRVTVTSSSLVLRTNATTLDTETVATDTGVWYEYYAKADGANAEVWRRKKGTTDAMVKVLETTSSAVTTAGYFTFASGTGNYLDDVVVLKLDGDTVETETQAYNAANEMTSHTLDGATTSFAYDQFGRMTQKTRTGGYTGTYYYNYGDKLTKVASNFQGEGTVTYAYSGDQKRRSRAVTGGAMTKYRVDQGWGVVNEENSGGTLLSTYIHHPGRQIGTVLATSEGSTASSGTYAYYFQDAIGSTRGLWDEDGERLGKYDYTPFGGKYGNTGEETTRKFTGHDWDGEARLYHTAYRQYSPDTGRWLTRDPLGMVDGPNVYAYVVNNPVALSDPLGGLAFAGLLGGLARFRARYANAAYFKFLLKVTVAITAVDLLVEGIVEGFDLANPVVGDKKCDFSALSWMSALIGLDVLTLGSGFLTANAARVKKLMAEALIGFGWSTWQTKSAYDTGMQFMEEITTDCLYDPESRAESNLASSLTNGTGNLQSGGGCG